MGRWDRVKQIMLLMVLFLIAVKFWNTIFVYPIKLFVVMLHEISHGVMAFIVGGSIVEIRISSNVGGCCIYSIPDSHIAQIMVASSGYIGSMLWGSLILISTFKIRRNKYITLVIGILTLLLSVFVARAGELFGIVFCLGFALFMIFSYKYFDDWFHEYMLKFLGLTSCLYVIVDIANDLILQSGIGSDADQIAELLGLDSVIVGLGCIFVSAVILYLSIRICVASKAKEYEGRSIYKNIL